MLERAVSRVLPVVNRAAEHAPMATACCNACRSCATTNIAALVAGGFIASGAAIAGLAKRLVGRSA